MPRGSHIFLTHTDDASKIKGLLDDIRDILEERVPERNTQKKKLSESQRIFEDARTKYGEAESERKKAEKILENCRAGILAETLKAGEKCPVCGSTSHPEPAVKPDINISEDELETLKKIEEEKREEKEKRLSDTERKKSAFENEENHLKKKICECLKNPVLNLECGKTDIDMLIDELDAARLTVESKYNENSFIKKNLETACEELTAIEKKLNKAMVDDTNNLKIKKEEYLKEKGNCDKEYNESNARLIAIMELGLSYDNWEIAKAEKEKAVGKSEQISQSIEKAENNMRDLGERVAEIGAKLATYENDLKKYKQEENDNKMSLDTSVHEKGFFDVDEMLKYCVGEKELANKEDDIKEYKQKVSINASKLKDAESEAEGKVLVDLDALKEKRESQDKVVNGILSILNEAKNRRKINEDKYNKIDAQKDDLEKFKEERGICERLYRLVRGTTGNGKITLEGYVQIKGFEGIINAANRRLLPMSDNQFELYRKNDWSKSSNEYLDLEVLDNYTGKRRPVGNLSGGESFKASLSLALGLSDTISSNSGGIQMDALFIDEGFGTLDRKSIENSMDILVNLSSANKLVGVISHREELMENIPQKIIVTKTKNGSYVSAETGI